MKQNQIKTFFFLLVSFTLVAFGHPAIIPALGIFSSSIAFAIFWYAIIDFTAKQRFIFSFFWYGAIQAVHLSWMTTTYYHGYYILLAYFILLSLLGAQFGCFSLFIKRKNIALPTILALSGLWTLFEWMRLYFLSGYVWNPAGILLSYSYYSAQMASLVGIYGMTFYIILTNFLFLSWLLFPKRELKRSLPFFVVATLPILFGLGNVAYHGRVPKDAPLAKVALIQTNLKMEEKAPLAGYIHKFIHPLTQWESVFSSLESLQQKEIDLIVLPEAAFPFGSHLCIYQYNEVLNSLFAIFERHKVLGALPSLKSPYAKFKEDGRWYVNNSFISQFISNYYLSDVLIGLEDSKEQASYNAAFFFQSFHSSPLRYEKQVLIPLAEYMPVSFLQSFMQKYGIYTFFDKGTESKVFKGKLAVAPSICYEECFSQLVRKSKKNNPQILVNLSNDEWFPRSSLMQHHFVHGKLRSIEMGVPVVRSCNSGVTAVVDCVGRVQKMLPVLQKNKGPGILFATIPLLTHNTFYGCVGDHFTIVFCFLFLLWGIAYRRTKKN